MQRDDYFRIKKIPLLIGGATTSRVHTAVKIAPHYEGPVVYVPDAVAQRRRAAATCCPTSARAAYIAELDGRLRARCATQHANKKATPLVTLAEARANKTPIDWAAYTPPEPKFIGRRVFKQLRPGRARRRTSTGARSSRPGTWPARIPAILNDEVVGERRARVLSDGKRMLQRADRGPLAHAPTAWSACCPANTVDDDDIEIYADESRSEVLMTWRGLRSRRERAGGRRRAAAEPLPGRLRRAQGSGAHDYVGLFAVTAGLGVEKKEQQFAADHDDYRAIMLKALADRLAEAFAERLHQRVRTDLWGYAPDEALSQRGADRREVPRHPAGAGLSGLPRPHASSATCSTCCSAEEIGMGLTESLAMMPAASVSAASTSRIPESTLLQRRQDRRRPGEGLGRTRRDVVKDEARRRLASLL